MKKEPSSAPVLRRPSKKAQIREYVLGLLRSPEYGPGKMLPALRQLALEFNTSVTPVIHAMREFEAEGLIEMVQGQGCRVRNVTYHEDKIVARPVIDVVGISENLDPRKRKHTVAGLQLGILQALGNTLDIKTTVIAIRPHDTEMMDDALRNVAMQRPNGLTFGPVDTFTESQFTRIKQIRMGGTEIVFFAGNLELAGFDAIQSDFHSGQRMLTEYLLNKGHREILRFSFGFHLYYEQQKQLGFEQALAAAGFPPEKTKEWTMELNESNGNIENMIQRRIVQTTGQLAIALSQRPITAVMAGNDARVPEVRESLRFLGRTDIEVTGYDGFWDELLDEMKTHYNKETFSEQAPVSVDTQLVECGKHMADLLVKRVRGELPPEPQRVLVPQTLIIP